MRLERSSLTVPNLIERRRTVPARNQTRARLEASHTRQSHAVLIDCMLEAR